MRAWLCLLAIGLLVGCHHEPPKTIDQDKATVSPVVQEVQGTIGKNN